VGGGVVMVTWLGLRELLNNFIFRGDVKERRSGFWFWEACEEYIKGKAEGNLWISMRQRETVMQRKGRS